MIDYLVPARITIRGVNWAMHVNLEVFMIRADASETVKLYKYMRIQSCLNIEAYARLDAWLKEAIVLAEYHWHKRSQDFVDGFKDTSFMHCPNKDSIQKRARIREENERLKGLVSAAKRTYDKLCRDHEAFKEHVEKYRITYY